MNTQFLFRSLARALPFIFLLAPWPGSTTAGASAPRPPAIAAASDSLPRAFPICTAPGDQVDPQIAGDGAVGAFVVWQDDRGGGADLYAHHLLAEGGRDRGWPWNGVALCTAAGAQTNARLVPDGRGGAIVTWQDERGESTAVYAQHLLGSGVVDPGWPSEGVAVCAATGGQRHPAIASDGASGALIAWEESRDDGGVDVRVQHVLGSGVVDRSWPAAGAPVTIVGGSQSLTGLVPDFAGGGIVSIIAVVDYTRTILTQRIRGNGRPDPAWPPEGIGTLRPGFLCCPLSAAVVSDGSGGAIIVGKYQSIPPPVVVFAQALFPSGALAWDLVAFTCGTRQNIGSFVVAPDGVGGAVMASERLWSPDDLEWHQALEVTQCPNRSGNYLSWSYDYSDPAVATDGAGGAIFAFSRQEGPTSSLYVQHVLASSTLDPMCPPDGKRLTGPAANARIEADGTGGAHLVWQEIGEGTGADIFASRLFGPYPTPVLAALVSADATAERVRLTWSCPDGAALPATVYRRTAASPWQSLGAVRADGTGRVRWEDAAVAAGERYGYRLGIVVGDRETFAGETWVEVPRAALLALDGAWPNPALGDGMWVSFVLPDAAPATLAVVDVSGRQACALEVGALGAGRHRMQVGAGRPLAPGVYVVRLTRGTRSFTARAVVVR